MEYFQNRLDVQLGFLLTNIVASLKKGMPLRRKGTK